MTFLDDVYIVSSPSRVGHSFAVLQEQLLRHSNIRVLGKIKVWNSSGVRPRAYDTLQEIATASGSLDQVWRVPICQQTNKVSQCWGPHWDTEISWQFIWHHQSLLERNPACSGCAVHCSSAALPAERITSSRCEA